VKDTNFGVALTFYIDHNRNWIWQKLCHPTPLYFPSGESPCHPPNPLSPNTNVVVRWCLSDEGAISGILLAQMISGSWWRLNILQIWMEFTAAIVEGLEDNRVNWLSASTSLPWHRRPYLDQASYRLEWCWKCYLEIIMKLEWEIFLIDSLLRRTCPSGISDFYPLRIYIDWPLFGLL
jgi:hypothetical protein